MPEQLFVAKFQWVKDFIFTLTFYFKTIDNAELLMLVARVPDIFFDVSIG